MFAVVPTGPFSDGYQDFNTTTLRVCAPVPSPLPTCRWCPNSGLAITDETGGPTGTTMQFEHGNITWTPWTGSKITWAPGSTPTATGHTDTPATPTTTTDADDDSHDVHAATTTPPPTTTTPQPGNPLVSGADFGKRSA